MKLTHSEITPERVKELKDMIDHDHESYLCDDDKADLFSILDEHSALRAENERLECERAQYRSLSDEWRDSLAVIKAALGKKGES